MISELITYLKDKSIVILGFGREGKSTYKFIRKYLNDKKIVIADKKEIDYENDEFDELLKEDKNLEIISGENYLENLEKYDLIIKAPGISFAGIDIEKYKEKITSQLELLLEFFKVCTIGITGTKGKSTTSSLIYNVLKDQDKKCMLLGNIGFPVLDYAEQIEEDMLLVLEMSSHQLEYMKKSPNIACLLNVYEEHLDHYVSFENYIKAKCNIFKYQKKSDCLIYNFDNNDLCNFVKDVSEKQYRVSINNKKDSNVYMKDRKIYINDTMVYDTDKEKRILPGDYNINNIMFVLTISQILKLDLERTKKSINEFKPLRHRLEFVGNFDEVYYYDNSIGTIPMATIEAVKALENVDTLIIGGMDRGIDYKEFIEFLENSDITNIICMPKTGHDIAKKLKRKSYIVNTMEEAVRIAKEVTKKNKSCLLSPAAASYGFFKNFEEKGDLFQKLVKNM